MNKNEKGCGKVLKYGVFWKLYTVQLAGARDWVGGEVRGVGDTSGRPCKASLPLKRLELYAEGDRQPPTPMQAFMPGILERAGGVQNGFQGESQSEAGRMERGGAGRCGGSGEWC